MNYFLLLAFMLAVGCNAQIKIYAPLSANDYFPQSQNSIINFTIANFGDIPYGKSIIGPVVKAIPEDGCSEIRNIKYEDQFQDNKQDKPIVLLKRGNCNFVLKVKNAQNAGAKLVIIADNSVNQNSFIYMADDGSGSSVRIPSLFIREQDGQNLVKVMNKI